MASWSFNILCSSNKKGYLVLTENTHNMTSMVTCQTSEARNRIRTSPKSFSGSFSTWCLQCLLETSSFGFFIIFVRNSSSPKSFSKSQWQFEVSQQYSLFICYRYCSWHQYYLESKIDFSVKIIPLDFHVKAQKVHHKMLCKSHKALHYFEVFQFRWECN